MQKFNVVPKNGTFGSAVDKINANFTLAWVAIGNVEYSTLRNKGLFASVNALTTTIPNPQKGDWAVVGSGFPAEIYVCNTNGTWTDSGQTYDGGDVNLNNYLSKSEFTAYEEEVNERFEKIEDIDWSDTITPVAGSSYPWTYAYVGTINVGDVISWEVVTSSTMHWNIGTRIMTTPPTNLDDSGKLVGTNSGSFIAENDATHLGFRIWEDSVTDTTSFAVRIQLTRIKNFADNSIEGRSLAENTIPTSKIGNNAVTAVKSDYSIANWQLFTLNVPDIDTVNGYISFGNVDGEDISIISQHGILCLNRMVNGTPAHPNLIIDGKIACAFRTGGVDGRLIAIFLDATTYSWVVRDLSKWDTVNETLRNGYPTDNFLLIGVVRLNFGSTYTSGDFKQGYFPFSFTINGSFNAVSATQADYALANWQLMSTSIPNVNTTTGYLVFGEADGADIYIASQKGILWLNHKTDGVNFDHPNLIHDGNIACPFKLGTTDTRSSMTALFLDTKTYSWVVRDIYCWDRANETVKNGYPTDGLIFIAAVVCNYNADGEYVANGFKRGYFPFQYTIDGKSPSGGDTGTGILDLNPSKEVLPLLKNLRYDMNLRTQTSQHLILLHFSDMHISSDNNTKANLSRIIEFYNAYSTYIDDILHTGDTARDNWDDTLTEWDAIEGTENILNVIGNHDVKESATVTPSLVQIYNRFILPYVGNWGVTQPSNAAANGRCYWYKDYTNAHIRLIGLDIMLEWEAERFSQAEREAQRTWLESVLSNALTNDYAVVIAEHYPSFYKPLDGCTFNTPPTFEVGNHLYYFATIVQDFIDGGGEFVCWLAGHTHRDYVGTLYANYDGVISDYSQLIFGTDTAKISSAVGWSDSVREFGKKSQDCANIVSVDRYSKTVTFYRIGCDQNRLGLTKRLLCWDYANCKMLNNK